jgi:hypothetical protein
MITAPGCRYWPSDVTKESRWARMDAFRKQVAKTAELVGWDVTEEYHSGAWHWADSATHMGRCGYATPEWEGTPGEIPVALFDDAGDVADHKGELKVELTGNMEMDALRVVLRIVNAFEKGWI